MFSNQMCTKPVLFLHEGVEATRYMRPPDVSFQCSGCSVYAFISSPEGALCHCAGGGGGALRVSEQTANIYPSTPTPSQPRLTLHHYLS